MNKLTSFLSSPSLWVLLLHVCSGWAGSVTSVIFQSCLKLLMVQLCSSDWQGRHKLWWCICVLHNTLQDKPCSITFFGWAKTEISVTVKKAGVRLPVVRIILPTIFFFSKLLCSTYIPNTSLKASRGENWQCSILTQPCNHLSNSPTWILKTIIEQWPNKVLRIWL